MLPLLLLPLVAVGTVVARRARAARLPAPAPAPDRADALDRRLNAVLQAAGDAYIAVGPDGGITEWNEVAERTFGWAAGEVLGRRLEEVIMPPEFTAVHPGKMRAHAPGGTGFMVGRRAHVPALHRDGRRLPVEVRAWASPDGHGWSAFVRDITDRVEAQAELEAARDAALAASRLKSEFLANMSHEIRTPMNGVIGMTTLLLATDLDAEQRSHAETVRSSAEALLTVIDDILDFSKIEAGKLDVETIDLDLRTVVEESTALLSARAEEKGLELTCLVDPDVPRVLRGDPGRLRQVLLNLLGNAVKFTGAGEVAVRARVLASDAERAMVEVQVRDTGIGVDPETVDSLFEAFAQADASTTRRYGGSGLGLAISRQLVQLMGGELTASGEPGVGSVFRVRLTLEHGTGTPTEGVDLRGARVLVVDDSPTAGRVLDDLLAGWGCETTVVVDARGALAAAGAAARSGRPFDVALLDLHMPGVGGLALARALAADPLLAATRTVLVGSALHPGDPERARAAGAVGVLAKPVRSGPLQSVLAVALGRGPVPPAAPADDRLPADERTEHVLLVEDNPVNQQVGLLTLQRLGCTVDVAGDGAQALEALAAREYDLVLMDCQMPVLDGFDATRALRRREDRGGRRTPVVALTASAMAADREECLAAGMDDHLSKPLRAADLVAVLDRWAGRTASTPTVADVPEQRSPGDGPADDLPVLDDAVAGPLRALGPGVLGQIGATYLADVPQRLEALRAAAAGGDADTVRRAAHAVKGASAGMGAVRVKRAAGAVEQAARDGELPAEEAVQELQVLVAEVAEALAAE